MGERGAKALTELLELGLPLVEIGDFLKKKGNEFLVTLRIR